MNSPARVKPKCMSRNADVYPHVAAVLCASLADCDGSTHGSASGGKQPCQVPNCARSGGTADAVRGHASSSLRDAKGVLPMACLVDAPRPAASRRLTPARRDAKRWRCQHPGSAGPGEVVPSGTVVEPRRNRHPIAIARFSARFQRFPSAASRVMCAPAYVGARTCRGGVNPGTLEPVNNIHTEHVVSGSRAVPMWFQPGTDSPLGLESGGILRLRDILAGRYRTSAAGSRRNGSGLAVVGWLSTVVRGRAAKNFGDFRLGLAGLVAAGAPIGAAGLDLDQGERNGGFPPFSGLTSRRVGRVMLEGCPQGPENTGFPASADQTVRLARTPRGGRSRPAPPPCPHWRRRRPLARWRATVSGFGSAIAGLIPFQAPPPRAEVGQTLSRRVGSGLGCEPSCPSGGAGGVLRAGWLGAWPRRMADASGRPGHVN